LAVYIIVSVMHGHTNIKLLIRLLPALTEDYVLYENSSPHGAVYDNDLYLQKGIT